MKWHEVLRHGMHFEGNEHEKRQRGQRDAGTGAVGTVIEVRVSLSNRLCFAMQSEPACTNTVYGNPARSSVGHGGNGTRTLPKRTPNVVCRCLLVEFCLPGE